MEKIFHPVAWNAFGMGGEGRITAPVRHMDPSTKALRTQNELKLIMRLQVSHNCTGTQF